MGSYVNCIVALAVGQNEARLADLRLAFVDYRVDVGELRDYITNVDPVPFAHDLPQ